MPQRPSRIGTLPRTCVRFDPLKSAELDAALSNCLSCKGCTPECPSNVNLALLKAEMLYARYQRDGLPLRERFFSNVDLLGRIGCAMPWLANTTLDLAPVRALMEKTLHTVQAAIAKGKLT